ncbi:MAG TPA: exonuclease SbcCD subunit D [Actinomycetota bacterium]|nr:exonuclease SbcCD subunit D [Actinomycetota bacterium]
MRILHVADLHQGLMTHSRPDPSTGLPSRLLDVARCWRRACEIAADRGVDLVVVAGDAFHGPNPDAASIVLFDQGLRMLQDAGIPAVLIAGNHDRAPHPNQPAVLELFHDPPLVQVATRPRVLEAEGIRIGCLPSVSLHQLMASRPGLGRAELVRAARDALVAVLGELRAQTPDLLTLHWSVEGAVLGSERDVAIVGDAEPVIPRAELEGPWAYVAAGHIHRAQPIGELGWYPGSVDRMNFGEEAEEKVALEVEVDGEGIRVQRHPLPARAFVTLDLAGPEALELLASGVLSWEREAGRSLEGAIVRVRVPVPEDRARDVDRAAIERALFSLGAEQVLLRLDVRREARPRAEGITEALAAVDAFEEWLAFAGIPEEERPALRELAKRLEEEVG